uniref:Uncharacterized protein n=1 Tax=Leptobrachium leishanense TaxID=445787 RepID=A0A8C5Q1H6_9ANUR
MIDCRISHAQPPSSGTLSLVRSDFPLVSLPSNAPLRLSYLGKPTTRLRRSRSITPHLAVHHSSPCGPSLLTLRSITPHLAVHHSSPCGPSLLTLRSITPHLAVHHSSPCGPSLLTLRSITPHLAVHHSSPCGPSLLTLPHIKMPPAHMYVSPPR